MFSPSSVRACFVAALVVFMASACGGDGTEREVQDSTGGSDVTGTAGDSSETDDDAGESGSSDDSSTDVDPTATDVSDGDTDADATDPDATDPDVTDPDATTDDSDVSDGDPTDDGRNACGGTERLFVGDREAAPGESCGQCADGVVTCLGTDLVFCEGATARNACGGCGALAGQPDEVCDECAVWACDGLQVECVPAHTGPECDDPLPTCDELDCDEQSRTCEETELTGARCGGCLEGFQVVEATCRPILVAPEVEASEGEFVDRVELTWTAVEGATVYGVYVEDERVGEVEVAEGDDETYVWQDDAAPAGMFGALIAEMTPGLDEATIALAGSAGTVGDEVAYVVRAEDAVRQGPLSEEAVGWRGAPAVDRFQREVGGAWVDVADTFTVESGAPMLTAGQASASQGTRTDGVALVAEGAGAERGEEMAVSVRAVDASGMVGAETTVTAWRAPESWEVVWEAAETAGGPFVATGLTGVEALDTEADGFGESRWYRACVESEGLDRVCGEVVEGWRESTVPVPQIAGVDEVGVTHVAVRVWLNPDGSPPGDRLGACAQRFGTMPVCQIGEETYGQVELVFDGLSPGQRYSVRAVAERLGEVFNGGSTSVRLLPAAVTEVTLDDAGGGTVQVSWEAAAGAVTYDVLRDGVVVAASLSGTTFEDADVDGWALGEFEASASDDRTDGTVEVTWTAPASVDGGTYGYTVISRNHDGTAGQPSAAEQISLTAPEPVGYDVRVGDGEWIDVELATSWVDEEAPLPVIDEGTLVRVDAESGDAVSWRVEGASAEPGDEQTYTVRARFAGSVEPLEAAAAGRAGVGDVAIRWERSESDALPAEGEDGWVTLDEESFELVDNEAPADRSIRWWRAVVEADPADAVVLGPEAAHLALEAAQDLVASEGTSASVVMLDWTATAGATTYDIWRDGELIAEGVEETSYMDGSAPAPPVPGAVAPVAVRWDDSDAAREHVRVRWQQASVAPGEAATYTVVAVSPIGVLAPASEPADGWRGAAPVTGWEVSRLTDADPAADFVPIDPDAITEVDVEGEPWLQWLDEDAPLHEPNVALNTRSLNDRIALAWSAPMTEDALREASYRIRAVNTSGAADAPDASTGSRQLSTTADVRLHRTTGDDEAELTAYADGPVSGTFDDALARIDGGEDTYRLTWFAPNVGERVVTASETRALHTPQVTITGTTPAATMGWFVDFSITLPGNPAPESVILCLANGQGASNPNNPTAWCQTHPRPWDATLAPFSLPGDPDRASGSNAWASLWVPGSNQSLAILQVTVP